VPSPFLSAPAASPTIAAQAAPAPPKDCARGSGSPIRIGPFGTDIVVRNSHPGLFNSTVVVTECGVWCRLAISFVALSDSGSHA
jgi:hypothetical protein